MSNSNINELLEKGKTYFANMSTKKKIIAGVVILLLIGVGMNEDEEKTNLKPSPNNQAAVTTATSKTPIPASDKITIFKDYTYGMSPQQVKEISKAVPCEDPDLRDALCAPKPIKFAGTDWDQIFGFMDNKLSQVALGRDEIEIENLFSLINQLKSNEYVQVYINNGAETFDTIYAMQKNGAEAALSDSAQFIQKSLENSPFLSVCFFPLSYATSLVEEKAPNAFAKMGEAPKNLRLIELMMTEEGVAVTFETPVPFIKKWEKKSVKEKF